ncbi:uncharacterized protein Z519_09129 [Cladophialophora bantiana CBS 173.52]|uniref:Uncharacterized protein n=1 Tax=Cladophialophora bantiana (strain ATCC 10958 / CBS 173.52 / CDC B-1940 / NIH 8579) TaxID=1442370 RepID=A0A0D2HB80_CLAB1|nr:uncharacterized protein Z519_09129 [Cladophialophora bantiana CBS 173.52]KIW90483.1 hypothetical protein Z519_09129 [Cladophialophora bantiana CBS 173.52]
MLVVWLAMGASFASEKNGNFRITFETPREELKMGLERLINVLKDAEEDMKKLKTARASDKLVLLDE